MISMMGDVDVSLLRPLQCPPPHGKIYSISSFRTGRRRVGVGRKARSAVHAEEGGEYESVVNGSLARGWVDWRG